MTKFRAVFASALKRAKNAADCFRIWKRSKNYPKNSPRAQKANEEMKKFEKHFHDADPIYCPDVDGVRAAAKLKEKGPWQGDEITYHPDSPNRSGIQKEAKAHHLDHSPTTELKN